MSCPVLLLVVVLNGLPIIPEIVVLKSFIGVVMKTYCSIRADINRPCCKKHVTAAQLGLSDLI